MGENLLEMHNVSKSFGDVAAVHGINFRVGRNEIVGLLGDNGAGKSTLMKILSGVYELDSGAITFKGQPAAFRNPRQAQLAGITTIYQELNQVPYLSVTENIFLGSEMTRGGVALNLDGKLWTEPVAGLPEIDNDLPTVPDE